MLEYIWLLGKLLVFGVFIPTLGMLLFTSSVRSLVEKHPGTWAYSLVKFSDDLIGSAILFTTRRKHGDRRRIFGSDGSLASLHAFIGIKETVSIRNSATVSVDIGAHTSFIHEILGSRVLAASILFSMVLASIVALGFTVVFISPSWWTVFLLGSCIVFLTAGVLAFLTSEDNVFSVLQSLNYSRFLTIGFDSRVISTSSAWGNHTFVNDGHFKVMAKTSGLLHGLFVPGDKTTAPRDRWLIRVPSFVSRNAFKEGELDNLCAKLNYLIDKARNDKDVTLDDIEVM